MAALSLANTPRAGDGSVPEALRALLMQQGQALLQDPAQLQAQLLMRCPQAQHEVALLVQALQVQLPHLLMDSAAREAPAAQVARLAPWLAEHLPCAIDEARWAVQGWLHALAGVPKPQPQPLPLPVPWQAAVVPAMAVAPAATRGATAPRRPAPWLLATGGAAVVLVAGGLWYAFGHSSLQIVQVQSRQALVSNGKPQEVSLQYEARNADIKQVDVRFLRGDGTWPSNGWTVSVEQATRERGQLSAGTLQTRSATPQRVTFEYTLVSRSGKLSAPFEKTFEFAPPATITQARVPQRVQPGQPFTVNLGYQRGGSDIVKVMRKVVDADVAWDSPELAMPVQLTLASGVHELRVEPPAGAQRSTLELTLVDAAGISSEPVRVSVAGTPPPAAVGGFGTVLSVAQLGGASGVGAVGGAVVGGALGNRFGRGTGRTAMTALGAIGGAVAGHHIEENVRGESSWETAVQMDGGAVRRIRHGTPPRWQAGSRVSVAGNSIQN